MTVTRFCEVAGIPRPTWYRWQQAGSASKGPWPAPAPGRRRGRRQGPRRCLGGVGASQAGRAQARRGRRRVPRPGQRLDDAPGAGPQRLVAASEVHRRDPSARRGAQRSVRVAAVETEPAVAGRLLGVRDRLGGQMEPRRGRGLLGQDCPGVRSRRPQRPPLTRSSSSKQRSPRSSGCWASAGQPISSTPTPARPAPCGIVTDNGPCPKSGRFAAWVASKGHIAHIRTPNRAPWTNAVIERFFGAVKYEHLYRRDITDGLELAAQVRAYQKTYNTIRPHQAIAMARPIDRYRQTPTTQPPDSETVSDS